MVMSLESHTPPPEARRNLILWTGCLAGPVAWFLQLEATYALASRACAGKSRFGLHLLSLLCLLLVAAGSWAAWRGWSAGGREWPSGSDEGMISRARFMGVLGLMACLLCTVIICAQWIAVAILDPCPP
jgi:hypothetical protein